MSQLFVTHQSTGVQVWSFGKPNSTLVATLPVPTKDLFDVEVSPCGKYLAVLLNESLRVYGVPNFEAPAYELVIKEPRRVTFSPLSTYMVVSCTVNEEAPKNLKVFQLATGKLCYETVDKRKTGISWTSNETLAYRAVGSEILFYEPHDFTRCVRKFSQKFVSFSIATNKSGCIFLAVFVRGQKAAPSMVKVYAYPHFENTIASQGLFRADEVNIKWNHKGDALLAQTFKEVDSSGKSYYGETALYFMDLKGTAVSIMGKKEGSVHSSEWLAKSDQFVAISGRMPANVALYNHRGEAVFQFGEASVNAAYINPFGNLIAFTGFGNLSGDVHVWNLKTRTLVSHFQAPNNTYFSWLPDGLHLLGGTHYARLKVDNGFKTFDHLGNQLSHHLCPEKEYMFKIVAIPNGDAFAEPEIAANVKGKVLKEQPVQKYIPPHLRTKEDAARMKKAMTATPDDIREKKIKNINKKLQQIEALKQAAAEGKQLERNQLEKITKERELIRELEAVRLS